jgi:isocitrate dehydrogenase (NAD+)
VRAINGSIDRKMGDGLFLNTCREVGKRYESFGIKTEDMIVDNASMQVSSSPFRLCVRAG